MYTELDDLVRSGNVAAIFTVIAGDGPAALAVGRKALVAGGRIVGGGLDNGGPLDQWVLRQSMEAPTGYACRTIEAAIPAPGGQPLAARIFMERYGPPATLLIVGAGHIAVPVAKIGKMLGYRVVVIDDRPAFANAERFPEADQIVACDFAELRRRAPVDATTYVVIVTRGHKHDAAVLSALFDSPAAYLGMIGSRRRVKTVVDALLASGAAPEQLENVYAPIGLDIGAETPEEIAVAILAEITSLRRGGRAPSLRLTPRLVLARRARE